MSAVPDGPLSPLDECRGISEAGRLSQPPSSIIITKPTPFALRIPDAEITDLRDRLARTRFPDSAPGDAWAYGTDVAYLRQLTEYWRDTFDWRAEKAALNAFPRFRVPLDDIDLH